MVPITLRAQGGAALYVTISTLAAGRFSRSAMLVVEENESVVVDFISWAEGAAEIKAAELALLKSSLRVEHLQQNL